MIININLTLNNTSSTYDLYSDIDNYVTPIATGLTYAQLTNNYQMVVDDNTTIIRVQSVGFCSNYEDFTIGLIPTPTPSPTSVTPTPTPTITPTSVTPTPTPTITPSSMPIIIGYTTLGLTYNWMTISGSTATKNIDFYVQIASNVTSYDVTTYIGTLTTSDVSGSQYFEINVPECPDQPVIISIYGEYCTNETDYIVNRYIAHNYMYLNGTLLGDSTDSQEFDITICPTNVVYRSIFSFGTVTVPTGSTLSINLTDRFVITPVLTYYSLQNTNSNMSIDVSYYDENNVQQFIQVKKDTTEYIHAKTNSYEVYGMYKDDMIITALPGPPSPTPTMTITPTMTSTPTPTPTSIPIVVSGATGVITYTGANGLSTNTKYVVNTCFIEDNGLQHCIGEWTFTTYGSRTASFPLSNNMIGQNKTISASITLSRSSSSDSITSGYLNLWLNNTKIYTTSWGAGGGVGTIPNKVTRTWTKTGVYVPDGSTISFEIRDNW